jgi:hypothetical protein
MTVTDRSGKFFRNSACAHKEFRTGEKFSLPQKNKMTSTPSILACGAVCRHRRGFTQRAWKIQHSKQVANRLHMIAVTTPSVAP